MTANKLTARWFLYGISIAFLFVGAFGLRYTADYRWCWAFVASILCGLGVIRPENEDDEGRR